MKYSQKIFTLVVVGALIIPQVTFASWWNPVSWNWKALFSNPTQTEIQNPKVTTENKVSIPVTPIVEVPQKTPLKATQNYSYTLPENTTLTRQQILANIDAMTKQGAPRNVIQGYLDSLKQSSDAQSQCAIDASNRYDNLVNYKRPQMQDVMGAGSNDTYNYTYHYNKSLGNCFVSIHEAILSTKYNFWYHYYYLFNLSSSWSSTVGELWYDYHYLDSTASMKEIAKCQINGLPCSSVDTYTKLVAPYLSN
jgi:hypothetical protein